MVILREEFLSSPVVFVVLLRRFNEKNLLKPFFADELMVLVPSVSLCKRSSLKAATAESSSRVD